MLGMEAAIAAERINHQAVTQALLTQQAVGALLSKKGAKLWQETVKDLLDGS